MSEDKGIKLREIETSDELIEYMSGREYRHTNYFHYSNIDAISNILHTKEIWLSPMTNANDEVDKVRYGDNSRDAFQLCFSTGTSENLPLWFLYSGVNGFGGRIGFKKSVIKNIIPEDKVKMELYIFKRNEIKKRRRLKVGTDCEVVFEDIIYVLEEGQSARIKHNGDVNNNFPMCEIEKYKKTKGEFIKGLIWFYEKETRLVIKLKENFEKGNEISDDFVIALKLNTDYKKINLMISPKYKTNSEKIGKIMKKDGIKDYIEGNIASLYQGQIDIDLFSKLKITWKNILRIRKGVK